jgi:hypothetical protein
VKPGLPGLAKRGLIFAGRELVALHRDGTRVFAAAPLIPLIAILPEAAQHVAEIAIGMFASRDAMLAHQDDSLRWAFGYVKVAGLLLAMLAAARFGALGRSWWDLRTVRWKTFLIAVLLNVAVGLAIEGLKRIVPPSAAQPVELAITIATLPLLLYLLNAFVGRPTSIGEAFTRGWRAVPLLLLLLVTAYLPAFAAHAGLHRLALGQPLPLLAVILLVDSVVVGILAVLLGTALERGSRVAAPRPADNHRQDG